jgi:hypothetical protein
MADVARLLNVRRWRLEYAINQGYVPIARRPRKRHYFSEAEIKLLAEHFGLSVPTGCSREG